ncbi:pentatricopeptide repeat-containing protein At1g33350 [Salvia miltiorrhiza]|uniref:pentatricopeptide repeat-containing protein At1g33350 n=1 Tax=Salvia miltiorrhiza TaxID=226208 RepID=UPI0025AB95B0|nr:pentatricopeptide repeat-containing protein At1g33350 [Salvia miltiorrhiza]XP_057808106.1 pentatricopeptide repeat-containing protein At1g33350 [Salvia miltiorrhiza]XP_057808107.1 pentatricopeptide repeat-containing protein At1g33350 [Salvia miltiorrhiza]XP_057808108.1 pentatricopeptide repeat-containing protein At1g33350 [Salvia miltiorrhiza]
MYLFVMNNFNRHVSAILDKCSNLNHLKQLHAHIITLGHGPIHFYALKLIRFCANRDLAYARHIFDKFPTPNIYLYTTIVAASARASDHTAAVLIYRDMVRQNRSRPNEYMFSIILKSWPEVARGYGVEMVQAQIIKLGFYGYPIVQTAVLDAYARCGVEIGVARKVFDEMLERSVVSWTAMISGYTRVGRVWDAIVLFEEMPEGIRDAPFWNSIIAGCVQNGLFSEAIEFFKRMVVEGGVNRPNQGTVVCVLSALGHSGMLQFGRCIHGYIYRNGLSLDSFAVSGLIDMYGKCGSFERSRIVFDKSDQINLTSWNALINCYALHGSCHEAVAVFQEMLRRSREGLKPDAITFVGLLNACTHGGLVEEGRRFFEMMVRDFGIEPRIEHYGCLVDLLGRSGKLEEAMDVVSRMREPSPDEVIWGSLLNACRVHWRADLAEFAVRKLAEMSPGNGGYGAMLANLYGEMEKWDEAWRVRAALAGESAYKAAGCSWIEIDNQVHSFYSVDRSHPRTEEIYAVLRCLGDASRMQHASWRPQQLQ